MYLHKSNPVRSKRLRDSARDEQCTLNIVGHCNYDPSTTVLAHLDSEGKGMALKSPDYAAAFACGGCHTALDQHLIPEAERHWYALRGMLRTWSRWIDMGLISIKGVRAA